MKNKGGRKSWTEELNIAQRYSDLSEPFFEVIRESLASEDKADRKWAVEQLSKAYVKMIPQDFTSGGEALKISFDDAFNGGHESTSETEGNS
jgi:hypothetical protein